jgi:hypothetical protein
MTEFRLGLTLISRGGWPAVGRVVAMSLGVALVAFIATGLSALPGIFEGKNSRAERAAIFEHPTSSLFGSVIESTIGDKIVTKVVLAGDGTPPPGVADVPAAGEAYVSPALASLIARDPNAAQRFPKHISGLVANDGLIDPNQLLAYVGVPVEAFAGERRPVRFGTDTALLVSGSKQAFAIIIAGSLFILIPAVGFLTTSARLSARARDQRLAAMRLIGMTKQQVRRVNAVEPALAALVGGALGAWLWGVTQSWLGRRSVGGFSWFASDASTPMWRASIIVISTTIVAVAVATTAANNAIDEPLRERRSEGGDARIVWRCIVLAAGVMALVVAAKRAADGVDRTTYWLLLLGGAAAVAGVSLAHPALSRLLSRAVNPAAGPTSLLTSRRLRHQHAGTSRILTGVLLATFAIGMSQGLITAMTSSVWNNNAEPVRAVRTSVDRERLAAFPGVDGLVGTLMMPDGSSAMTGSCEELRNLTGAALETCPPLRPIELIGSGGVSRYPEAFAVQVDWPADLSPYMRANLQRLVVAGDATEATPTSNWWIRIDPAQTDAFEAALQGVDPLTSAGDYPDDPGLAHLLLAVVTAGVAASFLLGLASVAMAAADNAIERRRLDANIIALGIPARTLQRVQFAVTFLPVALTVVLAAFAGSLAGYVYRRGGSIDGSVPLPWTTAIAAATIGLVGAAIAGAISYAITPTTVNDSDLRAE